MAFLAARAEQRAHQQLFPITAEHSVESRDKLICWQIWAVEERREKPMIAANCLQFGFDENQKGYILKIMSAEWKHVCQLLSGTWMFWGSP